MTTGIAIVGCLYALVFAGAELLYRKYHVHFLLSRKVAHIAGAVVSCMLPYFVPNTVAAAVGVVCTGILFISKKKYIFHSIHNTQRTEIGEVLFPLGMVFSALVVWPISVVAFQGSCLVLGFSDGLAGYVGNVYGKKEYLVPGGSKTIEGSLLFFFCTLIIFSVYYFLFASTISVAGIQLVCLCAALETIVEALFSGGWDNAVIPITSALLLLPIVA